VSFTPKQELINFVDMASIVQAPKYCQLLPLSIETVKCTALAVRLSSATKWSTTATQPLGYCPFLYFCPSCLNQPFKFIISNRSRILCSDVLPACLPTWNCSLHCFLPGIYGLIFIWHSSAFSSYDSPIFQVLFAPCSPHLLLFISNKLGGHWCCFDMPA
jgi:hypothetical protein